MARGSVGGSGGSGGHGSEMARKWLGFFSGALWGAFGHISQDFAIFIYRNISEAFFLRFSRISQDFPFFAADLARA